MPAVLITGPTVTQNLPFLPCLWPEDHRQYSFHLPTEGWPGWVDLGDFLDRDKFPWLGVKPYTVTHPSTNRAQCNAASLMWPTPLPLSQTTGLQLLNSWIFGTIWTGLEGQWLELCGNYFQGSHSRPFPWSHSHSHSHPFCGNTALPFPFFP